MARKKRTGDFNHLRSGAIRYEGDHHVNDIKYDNPPLLPSLVSFSLFQPPLHSFLYQLHSIPVKNWFIPIDRVDISLTVTKLAASYRR